MELEKSCVDFVESLLDRDKDYFSDRNSTDTLWELFLAGIACKSELLLSHCYSAIDKNAAKFFTWLPLTEKDVSVVWLADIMRRDTLYCPEYLIYRSVIQFAEKECKRRCMETSAANCRKVLGPLFLLIRFPQMTVSEIRKGPREVRDPVCVLLVSASPILNFAWLLERYLD
ncbi:hypothetical protein RvY_14408-1 [Ramazzottius varieornatus]|uniref:Uncharacterized protein n=1 Tax=Ramazzottius varieornatus TaxID=947166 RepID=A0A1D1VSX4_RAMVA|nr:hypothetical protein RvY_14408-1 [Ramazzottius varieornatus]